ncbi:hypothetical protein [Arthrobacter sp. H14]|uniref:hypothetical protein n=1 Tax=Arthrobacter sp. H14 TaxID=1312959 RepID=UPI00047A055F|nr:hypothetical protein [Arthrobacter sp. H14]
METNLRSPVPVRTSQASRPLSGIASLVRAAFRRRPGKYSAAVSVSNADEQGISESNAALTTGPAVLSDEAYSRIVDHDPGPETLQHYYQLAAELSQTDPRQKTP